ncbi:hypothetical protein FLONG3_8003 [Fusarium longipes]|uniref:Uncharacterized protein n=1 Tax=Fusarium longipes TaxID=694270 RepID=A0A395SA17_9HYPO|nr:hypothetical protein FLONG3_8003 [Fusarium longipes]
MLFKGSFSAIQRNVAVGVLDCWLRLRTAPGQQNTCGTTEWPGGKVADLLHKIGGASMLGKKGKKDKDGPPILSLGMTCTYFFHLLGVKMQNVLQKDAGPWRNAGLGIQTKTKADASLARL